MPSETSCSKKNICNWSNNTQMINGGVTTKLPISAYLKFFYRVVFGKGGGGLLSHVLCLENVKRIDFVQ